MRCVFSQMLKIKCLRVHDFVIGGWVGRDLKKPDALLLGEFLDGELQYLGRIGIPPDSRLMRAVCRLVWREVLLHAIPGPHQTPADRGQYDHQYWGNHYLQYDF